MLKNLLWIKMIGIFVAIFIVVTPSIAEDKSLYYRLGGEKGARAITSSIWENHSKNPIVNNRFSKSDPVYVKQKVFEILAASTGGPVKYTGKDMVATHTSMNISDMEFNAVVDDILQALIKHNIEQKERNEVLGILWSVKDQVVNAKLTSKALVQ